MGRLYTRTSHGRQPLLCSPKISRSKEVSLNSYQEPNRKHKITKKYASKVKQAKRRRGAPTTSDESSSADDDTAEDASDEDSDDDEPEVIAPPRIDFQREAGLSYGGNFRTESIADNMFGYYEEGILDGEDPTLSPKENEKRFEEKVFADSDDDNLDAYKGVDEISDSEDEDLVLGEQQLIAALSDPDAQELYLNHIDGLSAYGFGDESDATAQFPPSSQGSDSGAEVAAGRHVHFDVNGASHHFRMTLSESPTISRALLPSAFTEHEGVLGGPASGIGKKVEECSSEDEYDSDATDECLPPEAYQQTAEDGKEEEREPAQPSPPFATKAPAKKTGQKRGPPLGTFIDEGDKASGILDQTGKIMLITHPHLLGEEFARRYGNSPSSTPEMGFEELIDGSEAGETPVDADKTLEGMNMALGSLTASLIEPITPGPMDMLNQQFYPAPGFELGDYDPQLDEMEGDFDDADSGEEVINIEDLVKFDDSDDSDSDAMTSPIYMPPAAKQITGFSNVSNGISHLTTSNVTAFRRNADPLHRRATTLNNTPSFSQLSQFSTPARTSKKRKAADSPYTSSHYNGVTPVQRIRDPNYGSPSTPNGSGFPRLKRSRTTTA